MSGEIFNPCSYTLDDIRYGLKCSSCGMLLCVNINLVTHETQKPKVNFGNAKGGEECNSYFTETKLKWMEDQMTGHSGKLYCPKCSNKVGLYNWSGNLCNCGAYITPYFCIHKKKVDKIMLSKEDFLQK